MPARLRITQDPGFVAANAMAGLRMKLDSLPQRTSGNGDSAMVVADSRASLSVNIEPLR